VTSGFNLSAWALQNRSLVKVAIAISLLAGMLAFQKLGRLEDPNFEIPLMTALVAWPGATPDEIQNQILNRMEQSVQELPNLRYVTSFARQGYGGLTLAIDGRNSGADLRERWYQVRKKIGDIRHSLPADMQGPFFNDEYNDVYSALYALEAEGITQAELEEFASGIKRTLQQVNGTNKVKILGKQRQVIYVEVSTRRLAALGVSPQAIFNAIADRSKVQPLGQAETEQDRVVVRMDSALTTRSEVENLDIAVGGHLLRLADIAEIRYGDAEPAAFKIRHNGKPVVVIGVTPSPNANLIQMGQSLQTVVQKIKAELPAGVTLSQYVDQPALVNASVWEFEKSFLEALVIVLAVTFLFLGWRAGLVVAASVPLVLGIVAVVMYMFDWSLDRISLGALIISLGLLVDDAIISVEMMIVKLEEGLDKFSAASFAYTSTAFPMLTGTLVTVAGFMPVGFAKSVAGEYAGGIFWIVGIAMIASWLVAIVFTPYIGVLLLPNDMSRHKGNAYDSALYRRLRMIVEHCVRHRGKVLMSTVALLLLALAGMSLVQQQFFPVAARTELLVELRLKAGSSFVATEAAVRKLEKRLAEDEDITHFTAYVGEGSPRFYNSLAPELPNPGYAQFMIQTPGLAAREAVRARLLKLFGDEIEFPELRGRVLRLEFGPPVGFPVQFRITGPDLSKVREIASEVKTIVSRSPLVKDTQLDWNEQVRTLKLEIDHDKARLFGISNAAIASQLQLVLQGIAAGQVRRGEETLDIILRGVANERNSLSHIDDITVISMNGQAVPLSAIARVEPAFEDPVIWRRDRTVVMSVYSDVADGVQAPSATKAILPDLQPLIDRLPPDYAITAGGAIEDAERSNNALFAVFPVMILVMLILLMLQLRNFSLVTMVFLTFPLGLIGVVPALLLFNAPFGFVALLGVIALGGMIMRNSVILVDQIERDILSGVTPWTAIIETTVRRSRPVALTAAAAILAMIPLTRSAFWGPMAMAIMGGLLVATFLTVLFVPALYAAWFKVEPAQEDHHGSTPLNR
jgi:multidrug efflux pump subunit AcrB